MTIEDLKKYGAKIEEGLNRCMNNEAFYLKMCCMIPGDANFDKLYSAIEAKDLSSAFEAAHALKGSSSNLALTPISEPLTEITELLRAGTDTDYSGLIERIIIAQEELKKIM